MRLKPHVHQQAAIEHLMSRFLARQPGLVDGSDCGTGKTLVATEVMRWTRRPTLVVCPKPVIPGWHRHADSQGTDVSCINWEMVRTGRTPYGHWTKARVRRDSRTEIVDRFIWNENIKFLIFDEVHRAMSYQSKNAELVRAARRQRIPALALSATLADTPMELDAVGYLVGLHDGDCEPSVRNPTPHRFLSWARERGCKPGAFREFEFTGTPEEKAAVMAAIHRDLYPNRGVRVRISELGDAFPETQIISELYELGDATRIAELEALMAGALGVLAERVALDRGDDARTEILRLRQEIELLKVPGLVELAQDIEAQGRSVAIFVNFTQTLDEVCKRLGTDCLIDGRQIGPRAGERELNRLRFQRNESHWIVCNGEAGGVGLDLHDLYGRPRTSLIFPGYNAKTLKQILGRIHRSGSLSKSQQRILGAVGTVDERVHYSIAGKLGNLDALNDGDLDR